MPKRSPTLAGVVNLQSVRRRHQDFSHMACVRFAADREVTGLSRDRFADALSRALGEAVEPESVTAWETVAPPPGDVQLAAEDLAAACGAIHQADATKGRDPLDKVPNLFPAADLEGPWITGYQFRHGTELRCHVDVAQVVALSDRDVRITNHTPTPRTEGRALPFRNEIEAQVVNRHLVGHWRNTSDARYFGSLHLAILPGEGVMEGYYTGFGSDVEVSLSRWRWVRLDETATGDAQLSDITLQEPAALYNLLASYSECDAPLTINDVREAV